jgi:hypothetical protein
MELNNNDKSRIVKNNNYGMLNCMDPNHNAPNMICIPSGYRLEHVCPTCGRETTIIPPEISC